MTINVLTYFRKRGANLHLERKGACVLLFSSINSRCTSICISIPLLLSFVPSICQSMKLPASFLHFRSRSHGSHECKMWHVNDGSAVMYRKLDLHAPTHTVGSSCSSSVFQLRLLKFIEWNELKKSFLKKHVCDSRLRQEFFTVSPDSGVKMTYFWCKCIYWSFCIFLKQTCAPAAFDPFHLSFLALPKALLYFLVLPFHHSPPQLVSPTMEIYCSKC